MNLEILDNLTSPEFCQEFRTWLQSQSLIFGWQGRAGSDGQFWHRNYVLPGTYENHYDPNAVNPELTFDHLIAQGSPLSLMAMMVSSRFFNCDALTRVWINVQTFGDESAVHRDFPLEFRGLSRSAVWYPVERWEPDWGGDFIAFNDDGEIAGGAIVKPDRISIFDGTTLHAARPISRYAKAVRIAVAFGLEKLTEK